MVFSQMHCVVAALTLFEEHKADLIILDILLPKIMDGRYAEVYRLNRA